MASAITIYHIEELLLLLNSANITSTKKVLEIALISSIQNDDSVSSVVKFINKLLSSQSSRQKGLELLNNVLPLLPLAPVLDNILIWTKIILNISSKESDSACRYGILANLLKMQNKNQDFNKIMVAAIPKVIEMCLSVQINSDFNGSSLYCLENCLKRHPNTCGPYRTKIEAYLCKYLTKPLLPKTVQKAGTTFHFLQQAGGSGPDIHAHKNNWTNTVTRLCSTVQDQYQEFFANVTEFANFKANNEDSYNFFNDVNDEVEENSLYITSTRIKNIVIFLNCFLLEEYPTEKALSVQKLLDVIQRGLLVDTYADSGTSFEKIQFTALLYDHQIDLLYLLKSLVLCFQQNIMPFSFVITKLLMDCLKRCQKEYFKSNTKYQEAVFCAFNQWISISKNKFCKSVHNKLVLSILSEISYLKEDVKLTTSKDLCSKKQKGKKLMVNSIDTASCMTQYTLNIKEQLCVQALKTGQHLLNNVALQVNTEVSKQLCESIIQYVINIQKGGSLEPPYSNEKCQIYVYKMLISIFNQPYFCVKPYLQTGITLFSKGTQSNNYKIRKICTKGLNNLEKLCQATCPTLYLGRNPLKEFASSTKENDFMDVVDTFYNSEKNETHVKDDVPLEKTDVIVEELPKINILSHKIIKPSKVVIDAGITPDNKARNESLQECVEVKVNYTREETNECVDEDIDFDMKSNKKIKLDDSLDLLDKNSVTLETDVVNSIAVENNIGGSQQASNGHQEDIVETHSFDHDEAEMLSSFKDIVNEY